MGKDGTLTFESPPGTPEGTEPEEDTIRCTYCGGSGWTSEGKCDICRGSGRMPAKYAK